MGNLNHLQAMPAGSDAESVSEALRECAARRTMALVLDLETEWLSRGEFAACTGRSVALDVFHVAPGCFPAASLVSVAFVSRDQTRLFAAPVIGLDVRPAPKASSLELEMPLEIASAAGMIRYRVPVFRDSGLEISVIPDDNPRFFRAQAVNLSLTGILVEFTEAADPRLPVGARLTVSLGLGRQGVSMAGEVVRARNHQYGIRFLDVGVAAAADAPEHLRMILRVLERRWLRERIRAADKKDEGDQIRGMANVSFRSERGQTP